MDCSGNNFMKRINLGAEINKIYFIGIGGVHMSGIAELLSLSGYEVSGSDAMKSEFTERLARVGVPVRIGHNEDNIPDGIDLVVYTSAVKGNNPELRRARELGLNIVDRAGLLGAIMRNYELPVCVSGAHGKTTTTSMVSEILIRAGKDPTVMNGGVCPSFGAAMRNGSLKYFVSEADEYYDAFLKFSPYVGVILNIEKDHTDYFPTVESLVASFKKFAGLIGKKGALVINGFVPFIDEITKDLGCFVTIFSGAPETRADWRAENIAYDDMGCPSFDVLFAGKALGRVSLSVPGAHNIDNALAAAAACSFLGITFDEISGGLAACVNAKRRMEHRGSFGGVTVMDDYAHHPTEIKASLAAAKNIPAKKRWVVFQPHTRSRTIELLTEFSESFDDSDKTILVDIYTPAGREEGHIAITSRDLCNQLAERGNDAYYFETFAEADKFLRASCSPGDMVITMGAGDVFKIADGLVSGGNEI